MNRYHRDGFTIIEVMLFLAISGLMAVGLMMGISNAINGQRYRDAAQSFANYLQGEYDQVINIQNSRVGNDVECRVDGVHHIPSGGKYRGAGECSIIGRMIMPDASDSKKLVSYRVYTITDVAKARTIADLQLMKDSESVVSYTLEWDTSITSPHQNDPLKFTLLLLRLPQTGVIQPYRVQGIKNDPQEVIGHDDELTLCVNPNGLPVGGRSGVKLVPSNAVGASAVQLVGDTEC